VISIVVQVFLRCFRNPIRVPRIRENYHRVPRIVHTAHLTFSLKQTCCSIFFILLNNLKNALTTNKYRLKVISIVLLNKTLRTTQHTTLVRLTRFYVTLWFCLQCSCKVSVTLWFRRVQCLVLRSVLSVFINLRSAECVCSYYGLRVCS